jgi:serine/threonine protein kinase
MLYGIAKGLKEIHEKKMIHHDFHTGNILLNNPSVDIYINKAFVSDLGLCGEVGNVNKTKIYGVMPYMAPEVLRGKPYTQAADIYSFERQPFDNCAHDELLVLDICKGIRPEISEPKAPKCYIELMEKCWNSNPENRPNISQLINSLSSISVNNLEIEKAEIYRNLYLFSSKENRQITTHPQAIYTSRLLNPFTKDLNNSECLDCKIE